MSPSVGGPNGRAGGFFSLIGSLPDLVSGLIRSEINAVKTDVMRRVRLSAKGVAFLVAALILLCLLLQSLMLLLLFVLAIWLPLWAAALIVTLLILLAIAGLGMLGVKSFMRIKQPSREQAEAEAFIAKRQYASQRRAKSDAASPDAASPPGQ